MIHYYYHTNKSSSNAIVGVLLPFVIILGPKSLLKAPMKPCSIFCIMRLILSSKSYFDGLNEALFLLLIKLELFMISYMPILLFPVQLSIKTFSSAKRENLIFQVVDEV